MVQELVQNPEISGTSGWISGPGVESTNKGFAFGYYGISSVGQYAETSFDTDDSDVDVNLTAYYFDSQIETSVTSYRFNISVFDSDGTEVDRHDFDLTGSNGPAFQPQDYSFTADLSTGIGGPYRIRMTIDFEDSTSNDIGIDRLSVFGNPPGVPCFTNGTLIKTKQGYQNIDTIKTGDLVYTEQHCFQKIKWIGRKFISSERLKKNTKLYPICIKAGALGLGTPKRDLHVSRQHRILIRSKIAKTLTGSGSILIPAVKLTDLPGVYIDKAVESLTYIHLLFDQHEVIYAEGLATESLYLGRNALKSISAESREEILTIFPEVMDEDFAPSSAYPIVDRKEAKKLAAALGTV